MARSADRAWGILETVLRKRAPRLGRGGWTGSSAGVGSLVVAQCWGSRQGKGRTREPRPPPIRACHRRRAADPVVGAPPDHSGGLGAGRALRHRVGESRRQHPARARRAGAHHRRGGHLDRRGWHLHPDPGPGQHDGPRSALPLRLRPDDGTHRHGLSPRARRQGGGGRRGAGRRIRVRRRVLRHGERRGSRRPDQAQRRHRRRGSGVPLDHEQPRPRPGGSRRRPVRGGGVLQDQGRASVRRRGGGSDQRAGESEPGPSVHRRQERHPGGHQDRRDAGRVQARRDRELHARRRPRPHGGRGVEPREPVEAGAGRGLADRPLGGALLAEDRPLHHRRRHLAERALLRARLQGSRASTGRSATRPPAGSSPRPDRGRSRPGPTTRAATRSRPSP